MYIVEMNEKNMADAAECYYNSWLSSHSACFSEDQLSLYNVDRFINILKKDNTIYYILNGNYEFSDVEKSIKQK